MILGLSIILILVLFLPFTVKIVERNLEVFLFIMGISAVLVSQVLDSTLIVKALEDPIHITLAVIIAGLLFRWLQKPFEKSILGMSKAIPFRLFLALIVIVLGILSSVITAIIAAIVLVAIVGVLRLDRKSEIRLVIIACYSIGLGAVLTPIGEPLSTIATSKLDADFFYLLRLIGPDIIPGVIAFGILAAVMIKPSNKLNRLKANHGTESYIDIIIRGIKVYLFVMALTLLGAGFEPFIERYLLGLNPLILYWINMISAVLDNATLAAAEISPAMNDSTIKALLLGLLISGGMLIPGNIPNIIAAGKLNIKSIEWARFGVPIGLIAMVIYFVVIVTVG
jgi:predicted cation transporter